MVLHVGWAYTHEGSLSGPAMRLVDTLLDDLSAPGVLMTDSFRERAETFAWSALGTYPRRVGQWRSPISSRLVDLYTWQPDAPEWAPLPFIGFERNSSTTVGRRGELGVIAAQLARHPVVVLKGPFGLGKTTLAQHALEKWARQHAPAFAWELNVREDDTEKTLTERLVVTIAGLKAVESRDREPLETIRRLLEHSPPVAVLVDETHRAPQAVADLLDKLPRAADDICWLLTTQTAIDGLSDCVIEIEPLDASASLHLYESLVGPAYLEESQMPGVKSLLEVVGGVPLAIEMAAAHARFRQPAQLSRELADGGELGSNVATRIVERHLSSLSESQRQLLTDCMVFALDFSAEAARAVLLEQGRHLEESLESLINLSVLRVEKTASENRFVVPAALRHFVPESTSADAVERHIAYYLELGEALEPKLDGPGQIEALATLQAERHEFEAAFERCLADGDARAARLAVHIGALLEHEGALRRYVQLLIRIEDAGLTLSPAMQLRLLLGRGHAQVSLNEDVDYEALFDRCLALHDEHDLGDVVHAKICELAAYYHYRDHNRQALDEWTRRGLAACEESEAPLVHSSLLERRACALARSEPDEARRGCSRALELARQQGHLSSIAGALCSLGFIETNASRFPEGRDYYLEALRLARRLAHKRLECLAVKNLGIIDIWLANHQSARQMLLRTLRLARELAAPRSEAYALMNLGAIELENLNLQAALEFFNQSITIHEELGAHSHSLTIALGQALAHAFCGERRLARERLAHARDLRERFPERFREPEWPSVFELIRAAVDVDLDTPRADGDSWQRLRTHRQHLVDEYPESIVAGIYKNVVTNFCNEQFGDDFFEDAQTILQVGEGARWLVPPDGERVDLSRRGRIRRLLNAFVEQHQENPGQPLTVYELVEAGWPDQVVDPESGANRVYVTISQMRKMGLRDILLNTDDGYMLDPSVPVRFG